MRSIFRFATAFLLFVSFSAGAAEKSRLVASLEAGKKQTVVTYGTSLTAGGAWVKQVGEALNQRFPGLATVVNSGAGGMWSKWGVDNLQKRVIDKKPDAVFIEFAINDAFAAYTTSVAQARANLENMIDRVTAANASCEIILMVMNPPTGVHLERRPQIVAYDQMYRDVAADRKLMLVDHYPAWEKILTTDPARFKKLVPDGIHPAADGCKEIITPQILRALGLQN